MAEKILTLQATILTLVQAKKYGTLKEILATLNATDIASIFSEIAPRYLPLLFRLLPKELAADTFVEMDSDLQEMLIREFSDSELKEVINELYVDDAVDIVEEMPANVVKRILMQADPEMRKNINELLRYPEDSAGSIMTTEYVDLRPQMTVSEAIKHIRRTGVDKETINTCYIKDKSRKLIGTISIRSLILAREDEVIGDIMETNVISVNTLDDQEKVAQKMSKYGLLSIPVVDSENRLVGIVTVDDAIDVLQEETTEDFEKMAAITPSTRPYLKTSVFEIWKSRIPWLMILMISATFTGMIITRFEHALAAQVVLTAFIPMIMDTGGNSGSQSSVTIIRGLSLGELKFSDFLFILWKEVRVALLCGVTLAACSFAKLLLLDRVGLQVAVVVSLTLVATVLVAKLAGVALPMLFQRIGFDPAVMASPIITTIVDALALIIYFTVATAMLRIPAI